MADAIRLMQESIIAAICTVAGAILLEIVRRVLSSRKEKADHTNALRAELKREIEDLKRERREYEQQVAIWRDKYYALREAHIQETIDRLRNNK